MRAVAIPESPDLLDIKNAHQADSSNIEKIRHLLEFASFSRQTLFFFFMSGATSGACSEAPSSSAASQETMQPTQGINTSENVQKYREFVYGLACILLPLASIVYRLTQSTGKIIGWKPYLNKVLFETPIFLFFLSGILSLASAATFQDALHDDPTNSSKAKAAQILFVISILLTDEGVFSAWSKLFAKPAVESLEEQRPDLPYGRPTPHHTPPPSFSFT